jgi:hypothetical protein
MANGMTKTTERFRERFTLADFDATWQANAS